MIKHRWIRHVTSIGLLLAWIGMIFTLSSQTRSQQSIRRYLFRFFTETSWGHAILDVLSVPRERVFWAVEWMFRKGAHFFVYGVLAALLFVILSMYGVRLKWRIIAPLGAVAAIGMLDEANQSFTPSRTPLIQDVAIDISGGIGGILCCYLVMKLYMRKQRKG